MGGHRLAGFGPIGDEPAGAPGSGQAAAKTKKKKKKKKSSNKSYSCARPVRKDEAAATATVCGESCASDSGLGGGGGERAGGGAALSPLSPSEWGVVCAGSTMSGFGVGSSVAAEHFGGAALGNGAVLPQMELAMRVARTATAVRHRHRFVLLQGSAGTDPLQLYVLNMCHAEKQKLVDVRRKLADRLGVAEGGASTAALRACWQQIVICCTKRMCADCIAFFAEVAAFDGVDILTVDPASFRVFRGGESCARAKHAARICEFALQR